MLARKTLVGTVAANVLEHGTGAINVDGCRIGDASGRWPANVIFDEEAAQVLDVQSDSASRFFYVAKASRSEREAGLDAQWWAEMEAMERQVEILTDELANAKAAEREKHRSYIHELELELETTQDRLNELLVADYMKTRGQQ